MAAALIPYKAAADFQEEFAQANRFYEQKDYDSAVRLYTSMVEQGAESADVYYNLGNAYFKKGDVGHAVVNYLRAKRLDPSDEDIRHNLEFARQFTRVRMEGVELNPISGFIQSLVEPYRLSTLAWVSSIFFILFCGVLILRYGIGFQGPLVKSGMIAGLVLVLVLAGLTTYKYRTDYLTERVVIVADESPVLNGPTPNADVEFQGAPGLVAEVLTRSGDYYNVLFENKRRGWIRNDLVAEV
jgi:tetratricopeptide (TPR) repeat protein